MRLGAEVPLSSPIPLTNAVGDQTDPAVVSNGIDYLAVWQDARREGADVFATRVGVDGKPATPLGIRLGTGTKPLVASAGGDYLVVWRGSSSIQALHVSADGEPLAAVQNLPDGDPVALLSNGSTYLLVSRDIILGSTSSILNRDGVVLHTLINPFTSPAGGTTRNGRYLVYGALALLTIGEDGSMTTTPFPATANGASAVAFGPSSFLVAFPGNYLVFGYDGSVIKPIAFIGFDGGPPTAAWDGHEFLLAFGAARAFRISSDGIASAQFALAANGSRGLAVASNGLSQLIVWSEAHRSFDVVARSVPDFAELARATAPPELITYSGETQADVQIARGPNGVLAVWDDGDPFWTKVSAAFNGGAPITLQSTSDLQAGWPAVAVGKNVFLVVWRNVTRTADLLLAKRFDLLGRDLDPTPLVISNNAFLSAIEPQTPSIAFDGADFHVTWVYRTEIHAFRVGESGSAVRERAVNVPSFPVGVWRSRALWTGPRLLVGYTAQDFPNCNLCVPLGDHLATMLLDRTGVLAVSSPGPLVLDLASKRLSATIAPGAAAFAFFRGPNVSVVRTTLDGTFQVNGPSLRQFGDPTAVEIDWNGSEYVLATLAGANPATRATTVKAIRLDRDLTLLDSDFFDVSSLPSTAGSVWLTSTPGGVAIAYNRPDDTVGNAPRAFMRTLERALPPPLLPDLTVNNVTVRPDSAGARDSVTVRYRVDNEGSAPAPATTTRIEIVNDADGTVIADQSFPTPSNFIGGIEDQTIHLAATAVPGDYTVYVTADPLGMTVQSSTANDTASAALRVITTPACAVSLDRREVVLPGGGGSAEVRVTTSRVDCAWNVTRNLNVPAWFTLSREGGTGSGTFTISAPRNLTSSMRIAFIAVEGVGVTIRQNGDPARRRAVH